MLIDEIGIIIKLGFEDDTLLCLDFIANNGRCQGQLKWYIYPEEVKKIGSALSSFPNNIPKEFKYEVGSTRPRDNWLYHLELRAYTYDAIGHSALQIIINNNLDRPVEKEECSFSIKTEPWAIHRLGELLKEFSTLKYNQLKWSLNPDNDLLE